MIEIHHGLILKIPYILKPLIYEKNTAFKKFRCDRNNKRQINIEGSKQKYYCRMTNNQINTQKCSKTYWSLLKSFLNNKKVPLTPPLFLENRFLTDFKKRQNFLTLSLLSNAH